MQPTGKNDDRADVVVVGATVAGICAARGFAAAGASVLLTGPLRRPDHGLVHGGLAETPVRLSDALGVARFAELTAFARASPGLLAVPSLVRADGLWVAVGPGEDALMTPSARALGEAGVPATVVGEAIFAPIGIRAACGLRVPGEALVDPDEALATLLSGAVAAGVRYVEARPTAVSSAGDGVVLVTRGATGDAMLRAEIVVLADGLCAPDLVPWLAEVFAPVREQGLVLAGALPPLVGRAGHGHTWFRPWRGQVAVGGARWATPHLEVGETVPEVVPAVHQRLEAFARDRLGMGGPITHRWSWIDAHSCDGLPVVGPLPGDPRFVVCAGFGGNEWGFGPPSAAAIVRGTMSAGPDGTPTLFSPSRFVV